MKLRTLGCVGASVAVLLVLAAGNAAAGTVTARVGYGSGAGIQAKLEPAEFTVPAGQKAVNLRYSYSDPKSGMKSTTLGKNIYCITTGTYMVDASGKPLPELAAGRYRFFVGGGVGASGSLIYDLVSSK